MVRVYGLFAFVSFVFLVYCLLDVALSEPSLVRNLPKLVWVLLVVLLPLAGGIAWLVAGRPEHATAAPGSTRSRARRRHPSNGPPRKAPPKGPDDDPDFLRRLDQRLRDQRHQDGDGDPTGPEGGGADDDGA